jgi:hypothetical protein
MDMSHRIGKNQLLEVLEQAPFEHLSSTVHVIDDTDEADQRRELAGVSIYSNARGWMAQVNWRAVVDSDEITLRVGDSDSGERPYELRDASRTKISVEDEGGIPVSEDEMSALVAQSPLAKSWEQDVVTVLQDSQESEATIH